MAGGFRIIGHRGARGLFPENTLEGFQGAWALGVRAFELDVGLTRDGVAVVAHDPVLNPDLTRDAAGAWLPGPGPAIHALTAAELAGFDVGRLRPGSRAAGLFPRQRPHDGARVPDLAAVLAALPAAEWIIEIKTDPTRPDLTAPPDLLADAVLTQIDRADAAARVVVESFDWRIQAYVRRVRPDIGLAYLTRPDAPADPWWAGIDPADHGGSVPACVAAAGPAGCAWAPAFAQLTRAALREAHALGLAVLPWTVNAPADMRRLIGWGVDGIITDDPDILAAVTAAAGNSTTPTRG
ncbi:glycerophosphodiester phosphodiesterase family protein [Rhodopila sp.]|jgi:glycerophosphoryl diester phosphodiesterase|uniref:glycerophosphodiester phosphodiesterase family protein n=1 Tax=Rhodopila sp. TaxID=2480087 RepID=UPI002CD2D300|nr:glycerophosphodiester phosphodiesterase family protein [Rhodopila sp.]HVZ07784.1 glycerophosphodiester phosphodiesterase family protein [Rhodopila sp.]